MAEMKHISEDLLPVLRQSLFWDRTAKTADEACWHWTGMTNDKGYGRLRFLGVEYLAHRVAFALGKNTALPGVVMVCHRCDNPICVNPEHLFLGTAADNNRDMMQKGRVARVTGFRNGRGKLTAEDIQAIRESTERQVDLCVRYGVSDGHISRIKSGQRRTQ